MNPVLAEETHVPLPDEIADVVYMINLHHELAEPGATYAEAYRLLKPGGRCLVVDWAPRETPKGPPQEVRVSADVMAGFLAEAGFTEIEEHRGLPWHEMLTARKVAGAGHSRRALELIAEARVAFSSALQQTPLTLLPTGTPEFVAGAFLMRAASSVRAIEVLLQADQMPEVFIIDRSLVEDVCSLSYILSDPERLAGEWTAFEAKRVAKYYDDLASAVPVERVRQAAKDLHLKGRAVAGRSNWWSGKSPHAMAKEADAVFPGTLRLYLLLYAALCDVAHFHAPALGAYVHEHERTDEEDLLMAVQTTLAVLLELAYRIDDFLQLSLSITIRPLADEASERAVATMQDSIAEELLSWIQEAEE